MIITNICLNDNRSLQPHVSLTIARKRPHSSGLKPTVLKAKYSNSFLQPFILTRPSLISKVTLTMLQLTLHCAESSDGQKNGRKLTTTIKTIKGQKTGYTTQNIFAFRYTGSRIHFLLFCLKVRFLSLLTLFL